MNSDTAILGNPLFTATLALARFGNICYEFPFAIRKTKARTVKIKKCNMPIRGQLPKTRKPEIFTRPLEVNEILVHKHAGTASLTTVCCCA